MDENREVVDKAVKKNVVNLIRIGTTFKLPEEDIEAAILAYESLKVSEFSNAILSVFCFGCAGISNDISNSFGSNGVILDLLLFLCTISTGLLLFSIVWRASCNLQ